MKELTLELRNLSSGVLPTMRVDGKIVKLKKNKFGTMSCTIQTEKDNVDVQVSRYLEINGRLWFLMNIIYFLISFFGIFDAKYDKKCIVMDCKFNLEVKDKTKAVIVVNGLADQGKAVDIKSDAGVTEEKNIYFVDKKAKKRRKIAIWTRVVLTVAIVVAMAILI